MMSLVAMLVQLGSGLLTAEEAAQGMPWTDRVYRYRKVSYECLGVDQPPEEIREGIVQLTVDETRVRVERVASEYETGMSYHPIHRSTSQTYSLVSGEKLSVIRHLLSRPLAYLGYWEELPDILFLSQGQLPSRDMTWEVEREEPSKTTLTGLRQGSSGGVVTLELERDRGGALLMAEHFVDEQLVRSTYFDAYGADGPGSIMDVHYGWSSEGLCVSSVEYWVIVDSAVRFQEPTRVVAGAYVVDQRGPSARTTSRRVDRELASLEELGAWMSFRDQSPAEQQWVDVSLQTQLQKDWRALVLPGASLAAGAVVAALILRRRPA